jgi:hypothetical protein
MSERLRAELQGLTDDVRAFTERREAEQRRRERAAADDRVALTEWVRRDARLVAWSMVNGLRLARSRAFPQDV